MNRLNPTPVPDTESKQTTNNDGTDQAVNKSDSFHKYPPTHLRLSQAPAPEKSALSGGLSGCGHSPAPAVDVADHTPRTDVLQAGPVAEPHKYVHARVEPTAAHSATPKAVIPGKPRLQSIHHMPYHEFSLPSGGTINATIVEIIAILPQWVRNRRIALRFLNNGIASGIHFAILDEHRQLNISTLDDAERARDYISSMYRKIMRKTQPDWIKRSHRPPKDWDAFDMSIANFVPEATEKPGYVTPQPIKFKELAVGLKKLPQDVDAGDLTRALDFAIKNDKEDKDGGTSDFMFPDDIHTILDHIGRTKMTMAHVDRAAIARYSNALRHAETLRRQQALKEHHAEKQEVKESVQQPVHLSRSNQPPHQQPVHLPCPNQPPPQQPTLSQQAPFQQPYPAPPAQAHAKYQKQPDPPLTSTPFTSPKPPFHPMGLLVPMPTQQPALPQPTPQPTNHSAPRPQHYTSTSPFTLTGHHHTPLTRSSTQQAAASIAAELASRDYKPAAAHFPDIPDICWYEGEAKHGGQYNYDDELRFPRHWSAEQQMDALMAANQVPARGYGGGGGGGGRQAVGDAGSSSGLLWGYEGGGGGFGRAWWDGQGGERRYG